VSLLVQPLVGRAEELGVLEAAVSELRRGRSGAIELLGEPGMGKTRLLAELEALADARGHLVLSGTASELEDELPFWVFVDALDEYVQALDPRRLDALDPDARAELPNVLSGWPRRSTAPTERAPWRGWTCGR
jgi:predicted ATPase